MQKRFCTFIVGILIHEFIKKHCNGLNARFESAEATFVAGTIWLEGAVLAFNSVCKIFKALVIKNCVSCGSSSISVINLFHALHYAQPLSMRRLLLQGASKVDCTPSWDQNFPPFVVSEPLLRNCTLLSLKTDFLWGWRCVIAERWLKPMLWASIKVSQSVMLPDIGMLKRKQVSTVSSST